MLSIRSSTGKIQNEKILFASCRLTTDNRTITVRLIEERKPEKGEKPLNRIEIVVPIGDSFGPPGVTKVVEADNIRETFIQVMSDLILDGKECVVHRT